MLFSMMPLCLSAEITFRKKPTQHATRHQPTRNHNNQFNIADKPMFNIDMNNNSYTLTKQITPVNKTTEINFIPKTPAISNGHNVSYINTDTKTESVTKQHINGNSTNYYRQYAPTQTSSQIVSYNAHTSVDAYKTHQPFAENVKSVEVGMRQNMVAPPTEGPISDIILPLLLLAGIYAIVLRNKNN